jgi:hypothetical protein
MGGEPQFDRDALRRHLRENITVLNRMESHLGCVVCHGPLTDGRCPKCQPAEQEQSTDG